jgi:hypothetical protein
MTPTNPLDDKVIVDRAVLGELVRLLPNAAPFRPIVEWATQALAQDNTGWAAVVVEHTPEMAASAIEALNKASCAELDVALTWENVEGKPVHLVSCLGRTHRAILAASPPYPLDAPSDTT